MSEPLHLTILFDRDDDGWIVASIPEVQGAHSQGRTQDEARENVLDALAGLLELRAAAHERTGGAARNRVAGSGHSGRVKRRDLERHLRDHGAHLIREGARHSFWGFDADRSTATAPPREPVLGCGLGYR